MIPQTLLVLSLIPFLVWAFAHGETFVPVPSHKLLPAVQVAYSGYQETAFCAFYDTDMHKVKCIFVPKHVFMAGAEYCHIDIDTNTFLCGKDIQKNSY